MNGMRKRLIAFFALIMCFCMILSGCGSAENPENSGTAVSAADAAVSTSDLSFYDRLSALEGVVAVEEISQTSDENDEAQGYAFKEKYLVTFCQPLDHSDPSAGSFEQRVEIGWNGDDCVNVYHVGGYMLKDILAPGYLSWDDRCELCRMYDGNYIDIEYRFFGGSTPDGLSYASTDMWEYLTVENAAADFHDIITQLSTILNGKRVFTGESKGGRETCIFAYLYPDDADAFVPYVAPMCIDPCDDGRYRFIYGDVGDVTYGEELAAEYRDLMTEFQVFMLENRDTLQEAYWKYALSNGDEHSEFCTKEILFDVGVLEFATQEWQYLLDFDGIRELFDMPFDTEDEKEAKLGAVGNYLITVNDPSFWSTNTIFFSYYVQAAKQEGEQILDFSYLRKALDEAGKGDLLCVTEDMDRTLLYDMLLTPEQREAFSFDDTYAKKLPEWLKTTDCDIFFIYGACDPWSTARFPEVENGHVISYMLPAQNHHANIMNMPEEQREDITARLDDVLKG